MAWFHGGIAVPKPPTRKLLKGRKDRAEAKVKKSVRAICVERDAYCRLATIRSQWCPWEPLAGCRGQSEWAHLGEQKRFKTRGMDPEQRHNTLGSLMLCTKHHREYDAGTIKISRTTPFGADGPLQFAKENQVYIEERVG